MNKAQEILARTAKLLDEISPSKQREERKKQRQKEVHNGQGYVYTYDADGKPIPKSKILMEKKLGRPLHKHEVIVYLDGDRRNCEIENLDIGFKQNSPKSAWKCDHCGTVGEFSLRPASE